ncbi:uncharacterized protein LOC143536921 [Bidens hawaiensis]|uniref:uncharacterized protein LOC143536921 n=1 Tax=Bidens hawaiensis TaxID=980011 RepID=UPI00404A6936
MHPLHKIRTADQYDKFVCAENPQTHPQLHAVVTNHMIHGPCGALRMSSPCMEGEPKKCRFHYPRQFNKHTTQGKDAYPLYRRRDTGLTVHVQGQSSLDNRWVVPYNPKLLMMLNCHINLEICSSIKSVKYLFKYIYKGHNKQVIEINPDNETAVINEIRDFQDARYISPSEAMWRDVRKLWLDHYNNLSEDHRRHCTNDSHIQNIVLQEIMGYLESMGKSKADFDLPNFTNDTNGLDITDRETMKELDIVVDPTHLQEIGSLNSDQKVVYDEILYHVDNQIPGLFFIDGPGGTGKTFLYKALLATVRSRGLIALATASSGVAANNMPGGRTAHSRFKIPLDITNNSTCGLSNQSGTARLINSARLIIWDESSMAKRQSIEAVDRKMQDITSISAAFGGKLIVMGGDFRQVLPVVKRGTRAQIVDTSLPMSPLWSATKRRSLSINMRALNDPWFSEYLLRVGDGKELCVDGMFIRIPQNMSIPFTTQEASIKELVNTIFPDLQANARSTEYMTSRAILTTKNEDVDRINDHMIDIYERGGTNLL